MDNMNYDMASLLGSRFHEPAVCSTPKCNRKVVGSSTEVIFGHRKISIQNKCSQCISAIEARGRVHSKIIKEKVAKNKFYKELGIDVENEINGSANDNQQSESKTTKLKEEFNKLREKIMSEKQDTDSKEEENK